MGRSNRRMPGLILRGGVWHIDKIIYGTRVCESTGTCDLEEAEALLMRRVQAARATRLFGARQNHTFREAATKFLEEHQHKRSLERDARALATLDPIHWRTAAASCASRHAAALRACGLDAGNQSRDDQSRSGGGAAHPESVRAALARRSDRPWLDTAPLIQMQRHPNKRDRRIPCRSRKSGCCFRSSTATWRNMALFKVNTGLTRTRGRNLRWIGRRQCLSSTHRSS